MFWRKKPVVEVQSSNRILYENQILQIVDQLTQYGVTEFNMKVFRKDMTSGVDISGKFFNNADFKIISSVQQNPKSV
ncbi:hypothetical protein [Nitrososphaeria virus YSH_1032793]|uniref:Uncharacterized protein n=1 Tax=Nitrososphaeria virus YSH_1032793 TaxID=3071320 RepID=A0A976YEZ8_9CAUD|nr:hypothetical protein QKV91_gp10 [Yangshan Harbor Nitrososphaeria virus]UVF62214.1 hypothetical protein [Nitrososphaeria virus YSH_1032793]